jgi:hypothetical protein
MGSNYIRGASITCAASQAEIQSMLGAAGARGFQLAAERGATRIAFSLGDRQFLLSLPLSASEGTSTAAQEAARRGWRQLSFLVRAKLDAVACGITTFDEEFLAYMVLPGGATVFQAVKPGMAAAHAAAADSRPAAGHPSAPPADRGTRRT